jgi:hypothetical protein
MRKDLLSAAVPIALGVVFLFRHETLTGAAILLLGLAGLVVSWRFRDTPPVDPILDAAIQEAMKLEKIDPAGADQILDRAFSDATDREERELALLRDKAAFDRRAAVALRNRLRERLKRDEGARRLAEKRLAASPNRAAVLQDLDHRAADTRQRLAEAEQYVERTPAA